MPLAATAKKARSRVSRIPGDWTNLPNRVDGNVVQPTTASQLHSTTTSYRGSPGLLSALRSRSLLESSAAYHDGLAGDRRGGAQPADPTDERGIPSLTATTKFQIQKVRKEPKRTIFSQTAIQSHDLRVYPGTGCEQQAPRG